MNVFVTGAAGFIGSHLVEALVSAGHDVTALVRPGENSARIAGLAVRLVEGDVTDIRSLPDEAKEAEIVYHLAAVLGGQDPRLYYDVNFGGTRNLLEVCRAHRGKMKRFLLVSSIAAAGPCRREELLTEDSPCHPVSDYGRSKLMAENFLKTSGHGIPFTIVRLPLVYGPRSDGGLLSYFKMASKGICVRPGNGFTSVGFVRDIVEGIILAAESPKAAGRSYFLGDGAYSWEEIIRYVSAAVGKKTLRLVIPYPSLYLIAPWAELFGGIARRPPLISFHNIFYLKHRYWRCRTDRARSEIGFMPRVPFPKGLAITYAWYKANGYVA